MMDYYSLVTKLTDRNLSDADPGRWAEFLFYGRPTYNERLKLAYEYSQKSLEEVNA